MWALVDFVVSECAFHLGHAGILVGMKWSCYLFFFFFFVFRS